MEFKIEKEVNPNVHNYPKEEIDIAYAFSKKAYKEFGDFVKAIVLFGSSARHERKKSGDIDILVIINDLSVKLSEELVEAYRIITERIVLDVNKKIHVTTLKMTAFWEYIKNGDPIGINMLRDGVAMIDTGFFDPLQAMLRQGRIRPTPESIYAYFDKAPATLHNSRWHLLQATLDIYWAVIDAAHAALMKIDVIPPTPSHVADLLDEKLAKKGMISKADVETMRKFYSLSKDIVHREIKRVSGEEYDSYLEEAEGFVETMRKIIEKPDKTGRP
ncbi:hypothetical protein GF351_02650 [Candidatus Woesearchaeota archaeon]|nr:hypothetical protein [Candidatus Woesearchaeota archaeon]